MDQHQHHEKLIHGVSEQLKTILESSEQAIYVYLDDIHKVCNQKFAALLGYESPQEWAKIEESLIDVSVAEKSQGILVKAYQKAMDKMAGSTISVTWRKKSGGTIDTTVILVPLCYEGHMFALHFVS